MIVKVTRRIPAEPQWYYGDTEYVVQGATHEFVIRKEWYAAGPSLFDWVVLIDGRDSNNRFSRKRDALAWVEGRVS
jgi:hypothetical protein